MNAIQIQIMGGIASISTSYPAMAHSKVVATAGANIFGRPQKRAADLASLGYQLVACMVIASL
ncbi:hypothetical protein ACONUD_05015 [Microbulbifer harenosus]|uniref:hypothetical protein n=1 Tax=Microbulbifer TaxID=48073 RepID=UPI00140908E8|nr:MULTISPECIES: hypothetical protein [Microbulbifer]